MVTATILEQIFLNNLDVPVQLSQLQGLFLDLSF